MGHFLWWWWGWGGRGLMVVVGLDVGGGCGGRQA